MEYLHFLDSPKHISIFSSAKSRRHLEPSRNKASINLMMSQPLVVLISGYVHLWLMFCQFSCRNNPLLMDIGLYCKFMAALFTSAI